MPDKEALPAPNCSPGSVTLPVSEDGHGEDANNALAAYTAALEQAERKVNAKTKKFEAQDCPSGRDGCPWKSTEQTDPVVTVKAPIQRQPVKGKGLVFVCDLTLSLSDTIYCFKNADDQKKADDKRATEKREREAKARKEGK